MKHILRALLALALTLGLGLAVAAPASASYASCPPGQSCLYTGTNGGGAQTALAFSNYDPVGHCTTLTLIPLAGYHSALGGWGSGHTMTIYWTANCAAGGYLATLGAGQSWSNPAGAGVHSVLMG